MRSCSLQYTIVSCSSQDPSYPIEAIQSASIRSSGWQSLPNPIYPISFVVDFGSKVDLETLQFVSHQSKIPSKVDIYFTDQPPKFRLLGSFQFSDNSHTRYSARELKSANLQRVSARFIRVSIAGCHMNPNNPSNQVGIVSFKAIGKQGSNQGFNFSMKSVGSTNSNMNYSSNIANANNIPSRPLTQNYETDLNNKIQFLEQEKQNAVDIEDYKAAGRIKKEIDALKAKRENLRQLQRAKNNAIAHENYDEAAEYKEKIERLMNEDLGSKATEQNFDNNRNIKQPSPYPAQQPQQKRPPANQRIQQNNIKRNITPQYQPDPEPEISKKQYHDQDNDNYTEPEQEFLQNNEQEHDEYYQEPQTHQPRNPEKTRAIVSTDFDPYSVPPASNLNGADLSEERPINPAKNLPQDDEEEDNNLFHGFKIDNLAGTIPAFKEDESPECNDPPDELKPGDRQEATPLITKFGEDPVKRFFSKPWALRLEGIRMLQDLISGLASDYIPLFINFCYILRHRVQELQKQVVLASLNAVQQIADTHQIEPPELTKGVSQFLNHAVAKIGGSQKAITDGVCQFLIWLSTKRALDVVLPIVMAPVKNAAQWKAQLARIDTLHELLFTHGIDSTPGLSTQEVMNCVLPSLESPKKEVRDSVIEILVTIEQCIGSSINKYIESLPPRTKKEVQKAINDHRQQEEY